MREAYDMVLAVGGWNGGMEEGTVHEALSVGKLRTGLHQQKNILIIIIGFHNHFSWIV